ncbi:MAG: YraN family protein [Rickettsiaceae bacterium]
MRTNTLGLVSEYIVIIIYMMRFYKLLRHRMRNYVGEIDIVMVRNKTIVFIEVKARSSLFKYEERVLKSNQQLRIKRSAELFLSWHKKYQSYDIRFDLVLISPYKLPMIIRNAW